ncbi:protein SIEL isoform X2 [Gastrolobium bilobum]|uniref:protein SIEL isoform X2 n=1 Tax=Gastrolobium bilobum TaxID=150636 RepID=UPI002AB27567|nr:protein SIEL isoform X2 [Gastrolobium bilobum]
MLPPPPPPPHHQVSLLRRRHLLSFPAMDPPQDDTPEPEQNPIEQSISLHTFSSMRSLLINPSTPKRTVSSILETLTRSPQLTHHALKLLSDLANHHPSLSQLAFDSLLPATESSTRLAVESFEALTSGFAEGLEIDDGVFVSLCFGPSVPARVWMLRNAGLRFRVRPALLLAVLLGFTKDPYPYVREASLEGLVGLSERGEFKDLGLVEGCYQRAGQLLRDRDDCVRFSAVRVVASWGLILAASNADMKAYWSNEVFAKLCSMARDMSMKVRVEAFVGLSKMEIVSEDFLLQSLSKRVLGFGKQKETLGQSTSEQFDLLATSVAGALVHGLEDEFFEVRKSACQSLRTLTILSIEFAREALNMLMDILNDDSVVVRLQALETMHHMEIHGCLKLQEKHLHMFLGVLVDNNREVRYVERKIAKQVKLNDLALFKSFINGLMENLDRYPEDEADVFSAFSHLGRNHRKFVGLIIKEISVEVEAAFEGSIEFNSARIAALLILSISAPLLNADIGSIPPVMFSYAVTLLARICCAFSDVMDRDALLAYLCEKSRSTGYSATNINLREGDRRLPVLEGDAPNFASNEVIDSEIESHSRRVTKVVANYQSGVTNEVLKFLRCLKEELTTLTFDSLGSGDAMAFTLLYLRIIKLLAKVWEHLLPAKSLCSRGMGELESNLGKLDRRVKELMSRFIGFSAEEELNVLELILVTCALRLCKVEFCSLNPTFKRLTAIYLHVESLLKERSALPSNFVVELGKLIHLSSTYIKEASCSPFPFDKCLKLFSLKQFVFRATIRHLKAELSILSNDSEHPLPFVSGLPVGIPCEITLHNISSENRLWLIMNMDDGLIQYVFLDLDSFEGSGEVRNFAFVAPFYRTPKDNSLTLKVCIGLECLFENVSPVQRFGGPKHELVLLCKEKQVYLSQVNKN